MSKIIKDGSDYSEKYFNLNDRLLSGLSVFLNNYSKEILGSDISKLCESCGVTENFAYCTIAANLCGFDIEDIADDKFIFREYFPKMFKKLKVLDYSDNAYYKNIKFPKTKVDNWSLEYKFYLPFEAFVYNDMFKDLSRKLIVPIGYFDEKFAYPCVMQDGREWMLITPNEINTMDIPVENSFGSVLTFGLGLGYFAYMSHLKENVDMVTIVEKDQAVIDLFTEHILNQFPHKEKIKIIHSDAFDFLDSNMQNKKFDYLFVDIWHDVLD